MSKPILDQIDRTILRNLLADARTPYLEIARECAVSGATVHMRIQKLEKMGFIAGSRIIVDYQKLGLGVCAFVGLFFEKSDKFSEIYPRLQAMPEIVEAHYITGNYGMFLKVYCRDTAHLRELLVENIQKIPFVRRTETFISLQEHFNRLPDISDQLHDDQRGHDASH